MSAALQDQHDSDRDLCDAAFERLPGTDASERLFRRLVGVHLQEKRHVAVGREGGPVGRETAVVVFEDCGVAAGTDRDAGGEFEGDRPEVLVQPQAPGLRVRLGRRQ